MEEKTASKKQNQNRTHVGNRSNFLLIFSEEENDELGGDAIQPQHSNIHWNSVTHKSLLK